MASKPTRPKTPIIIIKEWRGEGTREVGWGDDHVEGKRQGNGSEWTGKWEGRAKGNEGEGMRRWEG